VKHKEELYSYLTNLVHLNKQIFVFGDWNAEKVNVIKRLTDLGFTQVNHDHTLQFKGRG